jgi:hypothetical protein
MNIINKFLLDKASARRIRKESVRSKSGYIYKNWRRDEKRLDGRNRIIGLSTEEILGRTIADKTLELPGPPYGLPGIFE